MRSRAILLPRRRSRRVGNWREVGVDLRRDVDRERRRCRAPSPPPRVGEARLARGAVGHHHAEHVLLAERARGERGRDRGVDAARQAEHDGVDADARHLATNEVGDDALDDRVVGRRKRRRIRRAIPGGRLAVSTFAGALFLRSRSAAFLRHRGLGAAALGARALGARFRRAGAVTARLRRGGSAATLFFVVRAMR